MNKPGEYLLGVEAAGPFRMSLNRWPHHAYSMASGEGKSTMLQHVTCQLLAQDRVNRVTCVDTKMVSLAPLDGLDGLLLLNDAENIGAMVRGIEQVTRVMKDRYRELKRNPRAEFPLELLILEEANDFADAVKGWYGQQAGRGKPWPGWVDLVAPILRQGRQVNVHMIAMFQDFVDNQFGGVSLKGLFEVIVLAGWNKTQWNRMVGTAPVRRPQRGPGRMLVIDGSNQTWVQGLYAEPDELLRFMAQERGAA